MIIYLWYVTLLSMNIKENNESQSDFTNGIVRNANLNLLFILILFNQARSEVRIFQSLPSRHSFPDVWDKNHSSGHMGGPCWICGMRRRSRPLHYFGNRNCGGQEGGDSQFYWIGHEKVLPPIFGQLTSIFQCRIAKTTQYTKRPRLADALGPRAVPYAFPLFRGPPFWGTGPCILHKFQNLPFQTFVFSWNSEFPPVPILSFPSWECGAAAILLKIRYY